MIRVISLTGFVLLAASLCVLSEPEVDACAPAPRDGYSIRIAEESAVIVWDSAKKVEHFIRRAAFDTKSPDFGFLVPTPTKPALAEVDDRLFRDIDGWTAAKVVEQTRFDFSPMFCIFGCGVKSKSMMAPVRVLGEEQVGGFNATILEADDADALARWLKERGYSADPELYAWLTPYVANKWKVTAFKIIQDPKTKQLATTKPVRMSFATERPFFPYREPTAKKDAASGSRRLRVFLLADARVEGKFGDGKPWHARARWSDEISVEQRAEIVKAAGLSDADLPAKSWLTDFVDDASPRPGKEEVYFEPSADRTPVHPPPIVQPETIWIPIDVVLLALGFAYLVFLTIKRAARHGFPPARPVHRPPPASSGPLPTPWSPP